MKSLVLAVGMSLAGLAAHAQEVTRSDLEAALKARDQEIAALEKRIAALEAERAAPSDAIRTLAVNDAPPAAGEAGKGEAELEALTRGLVERGALVLPKWSAEITPSITYSHSQTQGLVLVDTPEGISTVSDQRQRDDSGEARLSLKVGLPWRSQVEVRLPFDWKRRNSALGDGSEVFHSDKNIGDVEVELSHQFLVERSWAPNLVGAFSWRFPTGEDPYRVQLVNLASGGGVDAYTGRLTALKSIDPLVVFSTLAYTGSLSRQERFGAVRPGNDLDWQLGAILAVSPSTSLSFTFVQDFKGRTRVAGAPIAGSDGTAAVAEIGLDQVLSPRALLDVTLGIGVTRDAPDYSVMVSLPIRFR